MTVLTGYPIRNWTPSRFRISATAAAPFMDGLLGTGVTRHARMIARRPERRRPSPELAGFLQRRRRSNGLPGTERFHQTRSSTPPS